MSDYTLNCRGRLVSLSEPCVMGILNVTPDSFFAGSRKQTESEIAERANQIVAEGGSMIDVGAFSTRPGASQVSSEEEMSRMRMALPIVGSDIASVSVFQVPRSRHIPPKRITAMLRSCSTPA